jgi:NAD-dependent SIR2 family protein deacetylase
MPAQIHQDPLAAAEALAEFIQAQGPLTVLTGAGISTESGIPAYRDGRGQWQRPQPVQHRDFMTQDEVRQRYWARSLIGWPVMQQAQANLAHQCLAALEQSGYIHGLITQNVDRLHQQAGSERVIDLHGRADEVICMDCGYRCERAQMHAWCRDINPEFAIYEAQAAPDGDADLETDFSGFRVAECPHCAGILKPDVVYFGDHVPGARVEQARQWVRESRGLWVIGSSLMVFSGFRFCRQAQAEDTPICALNLGQTRADSMLSLKLDCAITPVLNALNGLLQLERTGGPSLWSSSTAS